MAENILKDEKQLQKAVADGLKAGRSRVSDGGSLYLLLHVKGGGQAWRYDYSFADKRKTLSLGTRPPVDLAEARRRRNEARSLVAAGTDPSAARKADRAKQQHAEVVEHRRARGQALPGSFREVFEAWHETKKGGWSQTYADKVKARVTNDVLPWLGDVPIGDIDEAMLFECLKRVQDRGAIESAHSTLQNCAQTFRFGIVRGLCRRNPAQGMSEALQPVVVEHMAAAKDPESFAALMVAISGYQGALPTRSALMLAAMLFQRPANIRAMRWADLRLDDDPPMWSIPSKDMKRTVQEKKSGRPHLVPLCPEAVAILKDLRPLSGNGEFVFVSDYASKRPMSENTLNMALRRMGIQKGEHTSHGFRASARTLLVERLDYPADIVEAQLAHVKSGPLGSAYDRAEYVGQRVEMMNTWGRIVADCAVGKPFPKSRPTIAAPAPAARKGRAAPSKPADKPARTAAKPSKPAARAGAARKPATTPASTARAAGTARKAR